MRKIFIFFFILNTTHQLLIGQTNNYPTTGDVTIYNYSPSLILQRNTNVGGFTEGIQTRLQDGTDNWYFGALHTGQWVVSKGNYANRKMTVLENGNVGIGATDPQAKLDINGDVRIGSNLLLGNWELNNNSWPGSGGFTYSGDDVIFGLHSNGGQASLQIDGAFIQAEAGKTNTYAGTSQFNNTINFPGSGIWNTSGNVGIGNTNPQSPLHIKASTGYGSIRISPISDNAESSMGFFSDANGTSNSTAWVVGNSAWGNTGKFIIGNQTAGGPIIIAQQNGNVGIGTTNPDQKFTVKGKIHAEEVIIDLAVPADYVFKPNYKLMPLPQVEQFVKKNSHLPEIPSASEITKNGLSIGEMQNKLLQKVEELTLYAIQQNKEIVEQKKDRKTLEEKLTKQEEQYNVLLKRVENLSKQLIKK